MARAVRSVGEALALAGALVFVGALAYLPHADSFSNPPPEGPSLWRLADAYWAWLVEGRTDDYEFTVHVDENVHWIAMAAIGRADSMRHGEVFFAVPEDTGALNLRGLAHERGFHVGLVAFQELTGVPWEVVFRFLPTAWMGLVGVLVWVALRPWAGAPVAAALVGLVPTTARFLGPGFLVPIGFSLAWLAAVLVVLPEAARRPRSAALLLVLLGWSFFVHLLAGFAVLLVVMCAVPFAAGRRRSLALLGTTALLPVLVLSQVFAEDIKGELAKAETLPIDFTVFDQVGLPFLGLWALGCALLALRAPAAGRLPLLAAAAASMVAFGLLVVNVAADLHLYALYDRWHQPWALLAAAPAAYAVVVLAEGALAGARRLARAAGRGRPLGPWAQRAAVAGVAALLFAGVTEPAVADHLDEPYYHVINDEDWAAFRWAAANVNGTYEVFLAHPWKAMVFTALTGKDPYTILGPGAPPQFGEDYVAYRNGRYKDGPWLVEREISLVVDRVPVTAEEFERTGLWTSQLDWPYAEDLASIRQLRGG